MRSMLAILAVSIYLIFASVHSEYTHRFTNIITYYSTQFLSSLRTFKGLSVLTLIEYKWLVARVGDCSEHSSASSRLLSPLRWKQTDTGAEHSKLTQPFRSSEI